MSTAPDAFRKAESLADGGQLRIRRTSRPVPEAMDPTAFAVPANGPEDRSRRGDVDASTPHPVSPWKTTPTEP